MSNLTATAIPLAIAVPAYVAIIYASNALSGHVDVIASGVANGIPMSTKHRYLKLHYIYVGQLGAVIAICMIFAFGFVRFASHLDDPSLRILPYLVAGLATFGALQWLVMGASYFMYCLRILREERRE